MDCGDLSPLSPLKLAEGDVADDCHGVLRSATSRRREKAVTSPRSPRNSCRRPSL